MATPGEKLAESLIVLKELQDKGIVAINTSKISRIHRERLLKNNYLKEVTKGWYISIPPDEKEGNSTSWYTSYWSFCAGFLNERYGTSYCLSAEQSLQIHSGNWSIPNQLIIRSLNGPNGNTQLPFQTSLFTIKSSLPQAAEIVVVNGIRMLSLASSLIHCSPHMFRRYPTDSRTALSLIRDPSEILGLLLNGGHSTKAGQIAGSFRNNGQEKIADEIIKTMQKAGYEVREIDLFADKPSVLIDFRAISPYVNRIKLMWYQMRDIVLEYFPSSPGIPVDHENYLKHTEEMYAMDAYHSLSIEKYRVSPELIERVRSGAWDVFENQEDIKQKDAMAARGYWQSRNKVMESIKRILNNENPGIVVEQDHGDWYRELFAPSVMANIIQPADLAGYRNSQVYISQSKHVPLNINAVRDVMPAFFELLQQETESSVRAVLGHFIFVYIHPYMDGNGRMARFLMNTMLASGGYPWTVIPVQQRDEYMNSLEKASVDQDIKYFATFIAYLVSEGLNGTPVATINNK